MPNGYHVGKAPEKVTEAEPVKAAAKVGPRREGPKVAAPPAEPASAK